MTGTASRPFTGIRLRVAQVACLSVVVLSVVLFIVLLPARYAQMLGIANTNATVLNAANIAPTTFAGYVTLLGTLAFFFAVGMCALLWTSRPDEWLVMLFFAIVSSTALILAIPGGVLRGQPLVLALAYAVVATVALAGAAAFLHMYPLQHFAPRWTAWLAGFWALAITAWLWLSAERDSANSFVLRTQPPLLLVGWLVSALVVQVYRYRRVLNLTQRQQAKLGFTGLAIAALAATSYYYVLPAVLSAVLPADLAQLLYLFTGVPLVLVGSLCAPVSIAISIQRYRLWDVDHIFQRTLIYTVLTGVVIVIYVCVVAAMQAVVRAVTGENSVFVIVVTTLIFAALAEPVRQRAQAAIDRRMYRRKYNPAMVLSRFGEVTREEVDLVRLKSKLAGAVSDALHPSSIAIWTKERTDLA